VSFSLYVSWGLPLPRNSGSQYRNTTAKKINNYERVPQNMSLRSGRPVGSNGRQEIAEYDTEEKKDFVMSLQSMDATEILNHFDMISQSWLSMDDYPRSWQMPHLAH
jgi:hypothetical protein